MHVVMYVPTELNYFFKSKKLRRMQRVKSIKMQRNAMVAVVWHDKRDVRIISTNSQPPDEIVQRRSGHILTDVPCPSVIMNYNKNMGGVDLADQLRSYYDIGRNAKKYWKCLIVYFLNNCVVNRAEKPCWLMGNDHTHSSSYFFLFCIFIHNKGINDI